MRFQKTLLLLLISFTAAGQTSNHYELRLDASGRSISGQASIELHNPTAQLLDTLYLHLAPRALEWRESFFQQQYSEFQKTDLYFADSIDRGSIVVSEIFVDGMPVEICRQCEFVALVPPEPLAPGLSVNIHLSFQITLPAKDWLGSYYEPGGIRLIDWLPEMAPLDSQGFHLYPVTWQRDRYTLNQHYQIDWELPANYVVASNATLVSEAEKLGLKQLAAQPFAIRGEDSSIRNIVYQHEGTGLQFYLSKNFYVFPMANGGYLFMQQRDPFLPNIVDTIDARISSFMLNEFGEILAPQYHLVVTDKLTPRFQSDGLLSLSHPGNSFELARNLVQARMEAAVRYRAGMNGFREVWLARGIPYYYKYRFIEESYPNEYWTPWQDLSTGAFWQPLAHTLTGWLLSLRKFDYAYQNQYLYLFLARQGLDQPIATQADSLTRLNYEAIPQAKAYLALNHLRTYTGERAFKRSMNSFLSGRFPAGVSGLRRAFDYYFNRDLNWFFEDWLPSAEIYDYRLKKYEHCPTVSTTAVQNRGRLNLPYSITGYQNGKAVLTEWIDGHAGKQSKQIYHAEYDYLRLNGHQRNAEWNLKDNYYRNRLLFPKLKPVKLQFYQSFEDPRNTQIFWFPAVSYNAYDQVLLRMDLYNYGLITRPWEWYLGPSFSSGQGQITGAGSLEYNYLPSQTSLFHRISAGIYGRYYHYNEGLAFLRLSPSISLRFRKPFPRSTLLQRIRLRAVHVDRELSDEFQGIANDISNASYTVLNLTHRYEETRITRPFVVESDFLLGNQFSRIDVEADFRWMLPNRRWLIWRSFAGVFLSNRFKDSGENRNYYSIGLSGTQDFMFDYPFIGRSDASGIWSQQFFVTDGGFKAQTDFFADNWLLATNLTIPVWGPFGVFGDLAAADKALMLHYDYGIRFALLTDFLEVYFPLGYQNRFLPSESHYATRIRYVLNLDLDAILHRLRRGYY